MRAILKTIAVLAVTMFTSCAKDLTNNAVSPIESETTTVTVGFNETKTYVGDLIDGVRKVYWSEGDQIAINGNVSTTIAISENQRFAEFGFTCILDYPYSVLYPAADYVDDAHINLPSVQEAADGTFATNCAPMACVAEEGDALSLHHLASVVRLQVKLPAESAHAEHNLAKVEFRGKAGEQVSGKFAIDYAAATLTATSTADADKVVTTKVDKALSTEAVDIFVVVPAGEYAEGFTVRLIDEAGHYMDLGTGAITLVKGDIKAMPAFDFVPTGTLAGVNIASAAEWNTFVAAYNNGDYADVEDLNVNITADLVFDEATSKNFAQIATFNGTIDGGDFYIKGLKDSNASVISILSVGSTLKNLNIDSSCNFKFTTYWHNDGVFVRENKGTIEKCNNDANITIVENNRSHDFKIGGLVGTNEGVINNCANNGDITFTENVNLQGNKFYLGGIVGYNNGGEINNSINSGSLIPTLNNGTSTNNFIGGIAGESAGSIDGCINNGVISGSLTAKYHNVGGIVGLVTKGSTIADVTNNTNNGDLTGYSPETEGTERVFIGGIAGYAENLAAKFESNTNNASVTADKGTNYVYVGGCLGWLKGQITGSFKNNSVSGDVVVLNNSTPERAAGVGGLVGSIENVVIDLKDDKGTIACTVKSAGNANGVVGVGGIIGRAGGAVSTIKNATNWIGTVDVDWTLSGDNVVAFGGIWGYAPSGATIENCIANGKLASTINGTFKGRYSIGGILGQCDGGSLSISGCTNKVDLTLTGDTAAKSNYYAVYIGGIVAHCKGGAASITNCHNAVGFYNKRYNFVVENADLSNVNQFKANCTAGIIAAYGWDWGNTALTDGALTITGCTSTGNLEGKGGVVGGIAGFVVNASITNCEYSGINSLLKTYSTMGGIVAVAANSSISNCTTRCSTQQTGANNGNKANAGGIAGLLMGECTVTNCSSFSTIATSNGRYGGIVGYLFNSCSVSNCRVGGTVKGETITSENYFNYVANGLTGAYDTTNNITSKITECSYWDGK